MAGAVSALWRSLRSSSGQGDLIIRFAGQPVAGVDDPHKLSTEERIGQGAPLEVVRQTARLTLQVFPKEVPDKKR
jgi:hypothetical protein